MTTFSGKVVSFSKSGKTFLIESASVTLADGSETQLIQDGDVVRGLVDDWRFGGVPDIDDVVIFMDESVHGEIRAMPVFEEEIVVIAEPHQLDLGACKGDDKAEPLPKSTIHPPLDEAIVLSWRDQFRQVGRWFAGLFSRGLKTRANARS